MADGVVNQRQPGKHRAVPKLGGPRSQGVTPKTPDRCPKLHIRTKREDIRDMAPPRMAPLPPPGSQSGVGAAAAENTVRGMAMINEGCVFARVPGARSSCFHFAGAK